MMPKRSHKIPEMKVKTESKCKWGLFGIFESCQGRRVSRRLISNGRRQLNQQIVEYPRKSDQLARFDEECRRFQNEVHLTSDSKSRSDMNLIQEQIHVENLIYKEIKSKRESESELVDHLMESQTPKAHHHKPFDSGDTPLNKVTFAELFRTVSPDNDNLAESVISEDLARSFSARKYDNLDEIVSGHQVVQKMNAKALVDQMYIERRLKDQLKSESNSFSNALEVLSSTKNLRVYRKEKEAFKSRSEDDSLKKSSFTRRSDDEIVVLKPKSQNMKYAESVSGHCSSMQYHHSNSNARVQESDPFSFKKMKKRLKRRFVGPKGPSPFLTCGDSYVLPQNGSPTAEVGNERLFCGTEIKNYVDQKTKEKLWKRPDLKYKAGSDFSCEERKKLDVPEFDVILEAKRHLSSRLENLSASDNDGTFKRPSRTLSRILLSPERDFRSLSPKRESEVFSGSAQMRCSPHNNSQPRLSKISFQTQIERQRTCLSPSRSNREESSVLIPRTGDGSRDPTGESKIGITKSTPTQESNNSEAASEINNSDCTRSATIGSQNDVNTIKHSTSHGSVSEHQACTSTASSIQHLDIADTIKYQEEHQSPVSVLEPIFTEEVSSPPSTTSSTGDFIVDGITPPPFHYLHNSEHFADKHTVQPLLLNFKENTYDWIPRDQPISELCCIEEQDHISRYVRSVLQACCLNWYYLSEMELLHEETELVPESMFDEVEFPLTDPCYFDPKLLFDHINEVLLDLYEVYCRSPPWLALKKPRIRQEVELEKVVVDEVMNEAEFYVLPTTERRTLDQLVSKDVRNCRSWLDVRRDAEQILIDISDGVLEESIVDILLGLRSS